MPLLRPKFLVDMERILIPGPRAKLPWRYQFSDDAESIADELVHASYSIKYRLICRSKYDIGTSPNRPAKRTAKTKICASRSSHSFGS